MIIGPYNSWEEHPNAKYMKMILDSVENDEELWNKCFRECWGIDREDSRTSTENNVLFRQFYEIMRERELENIYEELFRIISNSVKDRISILGAYDAMIVLTIENDSGYLLENQNFSENLLIARLRKNRSEALLEPAMMVLNNGKDNGKSIHDKNLL